MTFAEQCRQAGVCVELAYNYRRKHKDLTNEQVIEYYTKPRISLAEQCRKEGVNYKKVDKFKQYYKELASNMTNEEIIEYIKNRDANKDDSQIAKCKKIGIKYRTVRSHMRKYNKSFNDALKYYETKEKSLKKLAREANVCYSTVCYYKHKNPNLTNKQVILHYKPDYCFE
jgi:hypothetical protein